MPAESRHPRRRGRRASQTHGRGHRMHPHTTQSWARPQNTRRWGRDLAPACGRAVPVQPRHRRSLSLAATSAAMPTRVAQRLHSSARRPRAVARMFLRNGNARRRENLRSGCAASRAGQSWGAVGSPTRLPEFSRSCGAVSDKASPPRRVSFRQVAVPRSCSSQKGITQRVGSCSWQRGSLSIPPCAIRRSTRALGGIRVAPGTPTSRALAGFAQRHKACVGPLAVHAELGAGEEHHARARLSSSKRDRGMEHSTQKLRAAWQLIPSMG